MDKINEHISLTESPFYVNTTLRPWQTTPGSPRRAGVSSFGFSGTNAHLIIEEYLPEPTSPVVSQPPTNEHPLIFILSAKSEAQLKTYAQSMQEVIQNQQELDLQALTYTLQCGRDAMEYRLAFLATSREDLLQRLQSFLIEKPDARGRTSQAKKSSKTLLFEKDEDAKALLSTWFQRGKYKNILELWIEGMEIDWQLLYHEQHPHRLSLPTYPFARQRYRLENRVPLHARSSTPPTLPTTTTIVPSQSLPSQPLAPVDVAGKQHNISLQPPAEIMPIAQKPSDPTGPYITLAPLFVPMTPAAPHQTALPMLEELIEIVAERLQLDQNDVDPDSTFVDMGMDTLAANELMHAINKRYETSLPATILYDHPGIRELAEFFHQKPLDQPSAHRNPPSHSIDTVERLPAHPLPSLGTLLDELSLSLAEALFKDESNIDIDMSFVDMGMDSIVAVEWVRALNKKYKTKLLATAIYDFSSLRKLAESLHQEFAQRGYQYPDQSPAKIASKNLQAESPTPATTIVASEHQPAMDRTESPVSLPPLEQERYPAQAAQTVQVAATSSHEPETIAIVGISGRYPGASNLHHYWENLSQGKNCVREIPSERWDTSRYYDPRPFQAGKINCKWLGMLDDIEYFDPLFFNIAPGEAEVIDPQQRLFLEEAYKAFEDAGYSPQSLNNQKCNVYLGIMGNEYGQMVAQRHAGVASTTGNSSAIAAARLPYFLNLKGAAIAIDTACSSSLVATHLACQALAHHETDMALIGGVTLYLAPESYLDMCAAGMLSPDGQCKTFDTNANGFVPGEGVGAVVLKRLHDAEADHDTIYGVIIGSGINQDGKTNGITAPNMSGQMELLREVYQHYHIDPETISYVETHGTGTKLGDPIELEALSRVFKESTMKQQFCAIGSVKSNIGHTSAAAGVASLHKVLLCLHHQQLVPSLHFHRPNENFDFANSPLYVNTETRPWTSPGNMPRRACISSFGYSGTNAHLVIEEYRSRTARPQPIKHDPNRQHKILFTLSAQSEPQLYTYARLLHDWTTTHPDFALADLAYTLQVGRRAMDYRLAFVAHSQEELHETLARLLTKQTAYGIHMAHITKGKHGRGIFEGDEEAQSRLNSWLKNGDLHSIAAAWTTGLTVDWTQLYADHQPHRLNLPTYPFARERYWLPEQKIATTFNHGSPIAPEMPIHPLIQTRISDPTGQHFCSTFTGNEFFLADHVIRGVRMLPGAAYLEMARVAFVEAAGPLYKTQPLRLKNIIWSHALTIENHPRTVHTRLSLTRHSDISYEIYTSDTHDDDAQYVLSQGQMTLNMEPSVTSMLDLAALQTQCNQDSLSATECYASFCALGIEYGPGFQSIHHLFIGQGCVLAKLFLPASVIGTQSDYLLHPSLLDAAFQASLGLHIGEQSRFLSLPFALEELEILRPCTATMWAWVRYRSDATATPPTTTYTHPAHYLDIDLCDEFGTLCLRLKGFLTRTLLDQKNQTTSQASTGVLLLQPHWQEQPIISTTHTPSYSQRRVIFLEAASATSL
jgi:polyketide synthase PksN